MTQPRFFQNEFDRLAVNGFIGDPQGRSGYAYLRVSSAGQADEGRSGLPRQIQRVHEIAERRGIKIPWELVFADDHTGFEFRDRPELGHLRQEYKRRDRRANVVVIEYLDRLSRNADWHQGFLLDEMQEYGIEVLFWKGFSSRIERAVMGAISQEGMERELQNMHEGTLRKARSGRVTAKTPNYGYIFVDAEGKQSPKVKKETYYALHEEEAAVIELIYQKVGIEGWGGIKLSTWLEKRFPPPRSYKHWEATQIREFIRNPVYKGEFAAHRYQHVKVPGRMQRPGEPVRLVSRKIQRPVEDWIIVPVPPIVSAELWEAANRMLDQNLKTARRNGKAPYLLTGLVRCASCGYSFSGVYTRRKHKNQSWFYYRCASRYNRMPVISDEIGCQQPHVSGEVLEHAVWSCVCQTLMEPDLLIAQLDAELEQGENASLERQVAFIEKQIRELDVEDGKLYRAYLADVFDEQEFAARRRHLKERGHLLESELGEIQKRQVTQEEIEADKAMIRSIAGQMKEAGVALDAPFELRQRILRMVVDSIVVDASAQSFELQGQIRGTFSLADFSPIAGAPMGRDSWPLPAQNWPERSANPKPG